MTNRLFVALEIPEAILDQIIEFRNEIYGYDSNVRWESKEKLHITLKFIGDVEDSLTPEIEKIITGVSREFDPVELEFYKFGLFYRNNKPSIIWAGLKPNKMLEYLASSIDDKLSSIGIKKEKRKFKPHLTLLRVRGREDFNRLEEFPKYAIDDLDFQGNKVILFKSELKKSGSVYTAIKSFELQVWRNNVFRKGCKIKNS